MSVSYVYLIRAATLGHLKIGKADDVARRLATLQTGCPDLLEVISTVRFVRPSLAESRRAAQVVERDLHSRFEPFHLRGEWFRHANVIQLEFDRMHREFANQKGQ